MTPVTRLTLWAALAATPYVPGLVAAPTQPAAVAVDGAALLATLGFTAAEVAAVDRGQVVAKVMDTDRRQIAVAGAVRIAGSRARLVDRFRSVQYLKGSAVVHDVGVFSTPPVARDLDALPIEEYDLDIRSCRPGDCRVRLSAEAIGRFQREVPWGAPGWQQKSAGLWRETLAALTAAYLDRGPAALPVYANKEETLSVRDELRVLLADSAFVGRVAPALLAHLSNPSEPRLEGAERMTYWAKEDFGVRPIMRITDQIIYPGRATTAHAAAVVIAATQIYADHYLDAALGWTLMIDCTKSGGAEEFYLIAVNRARTRSLTGVVRTFVRSTAQNRSRAAMSRILTAARAGVQ